ncbi:MAG: serine hydrolase [Bryobacteraceae bacterium]|nr:serine hydrolase [Bryobacteraceae bacterium]
MAVWAQTGVDVPELAAFGDAVNTVMTRHQIPGASMAIVYEGRLVYARGFGLVDRDRAERVQPDSIFRVASLSKVINGIAAMKLVDQGRLRLDDLAFASVLSDLAPPAPATKLSVYNQITVRQLLTHTSGFPFLAGDLNGGTAQTQAARAVGVDRSLLTADQIIRWQLGQPLPNVPGQTYEYSNGGVIASGRVIAKAAGKPYERFIVDDILTPMGIVRTRVGRSQRQDAFPGEVRYHMPVGTARVQSIFPGVGLEDLPYVFSVPVQDASGGWTTTAVDMARLVGRLNPLRGDTVISAAAFQEMIRRPAPPVSQNVNNWYGVGTQVLDLGGGSYRLTHAGSLPGTNAQMLRYYPLDLTVIAIFNQRGTGDNDTIVINELFPLLTTAVNNYSRSGRPWPSHDFSGLYFPGDRPRASAAGTLNAASFKGGAVAPGEVITIFGERLGDTALTTARLVSGKLATELAGTRVLFDGVAAPLVYASGGQVSAIVPYSVSGKSTVQMEVESRGVRSEAVALSVAEAAPALFTANSSGSGPVAAQMYPEARVVVLYATGEGLVDPLPQDGELAVGQVLPAPRLPVKVLLAGREVPILYAGAAPGLTAGVMQVNISVPEDLAGQRDLPVVLQVGTTRSPDGVTLTLR